MATSGQKWRRTIVDIIVIYIWINIRGLHGVASQYANVTQQTLCQAQCEALCLDHVPTCELDCYGNRSWVSQCDEPVCEGTCSVLENDFKLNQDKLPARPNLTITLSLGRGLELSWPPSSPSNLTTIYIIEQTKPIVSLPGLNSYKIIGWVRNNRYRIDGFEACSRNSYRVMAINRYGTVGFSARAKSLGLNPGLINNIRYVGAGVYFYKDVDSTKSVFMAILQWDTPQGWNSSEIRNYEWNHMTHRYCQEISHDSLPMFHQMENQSNHILLTIGAQSIGCTFTAQVRATSVCNVTGPWTAFKVDLTDCNKIIGYECQDAAYDPPGLVENVTLSISATPFSELMKFYKQPFSINGYTNSPLLINLHIAWNPPTDLGSEKTIDKYIIRSGKVQRYLFPIPPEFSEEPDVKNVSANIGELIFQLETTHIPYDYGVQVLAVSPGQVIQNNEWNMFPMYTMQIDRNDSLADLRQKGKILLDEAGIVIVYINNTLPVSFVFDSPLGKSANVTFDRYALQWGPLVGPNSNEIMIENRTIVPMNHSCLTVFLLQPKKKYGIKVKYLSENDTDARDDELWDSELWDDVPTLFITLPDTYQADTEESQTDRPSYLTAIYVIVPVVLAFILSLMFLRQLRRKQHFKHLERRLVMARDSDVDSLTGDHYFIMRPAGNETSDEDDIPTVVTDLWELPHCCIKIGRILGSGAFGQVVKGRVSRSVLDSRGIDFQSQHSGLGTHVTVAVKMLQEFSDEKYSQDFLKEIQMMKSIGYHRNIVSMLGCCTLREPFCLLVEYVPLGDLQTYLRKIRQQIEKREEEVGPYVNQEVELFTPHDLLSFARQIVTGMEYLSQKGFVHRDLAARNILVGDNSLVKIADFGLARYIYHDVGKVYVNRHGGRLPLKWMAPESISDMTFSTASDVWSFGILLFEIVTLGAVPYPHLSNTDLLQALKQRYVMEKPENCSTEIYDVMKSCWLYIPASRPSFGQLRETFTAMLEEESGRDYFDFKVHEDRLYYRIDSDEMDQDSFSAEASDDPDGATTIMGASAAVHVSAIVHEIPDENCSIEKFTKADINNGTAGMGGNNDYSTAAFRRNASTTSSFHNELYQDIDDDRIVGLQNVCAFSNSIEGEVVSTGSDEVFEDCRVCAQMELCQKIDVPPPCQKCCVRDIHLKHLDIKVSERNDSGLGSDSVSTRYHTDSSNSSLDINEYVIPDSPVEMSFECRVRNATRDFTCDDDPRRIYDHFFANLQTDDDNDSTISGQNATQTQGGRSETIGPQSAPTIVVRSRNRATERDVWSVAETKL